MTQLKSQLIRSTDFELRLAFNLVVVGLYYATVSISCCFTQSIEIYLYNHLLVQGSHDGEPLIQREGVVLGLHIPCKPHSSNIQSYIFDDFVRNTLDLTHLNCGLELLWSWLAGFLFVHCTPTLKNLCTKSHAREIPSKQQEN